MTPSLRKLIGTVLLLLSIPIWALVATWLYMAGLGAAPWWLLLVYFCVAGLAWMVPAMWIIRWSSRA